MPYYFGIFFALIALFAWGFSDFLIQKSSRAIGTWKVLFSVGIVGSIILFPFIRGEISSLESKDFLLLAVLGLVIFFAALLNFEALKKGKIAIIEPLIGMELPITVALSIAFGKDKLSLIELCLVAVVFVGLLMVVTMHHKHLHQSRKTIEKGVLLAVAAAIGLALTNFLVGISSRQISPLMVIWFAQTQIAVMCIIFLVYTKQFRPVLTGLISHLKLTLGESLLYNLGWVAFALATTSVAISIVTAISESYIVLGVILGIFVNHEKIRRYQIVGIVLATIGILALSAFAIN